MKTLYVYFENTQCVFISYIEYINTLGHCASTSIVQGCILFKTEGPEPQIKHISVDPVLGINETQGFGSEDTYRWTRLSRPAWGSDGSRHTVRTVLSSRANRSGGSLREQAEQKQEDLKFVLWQTSTSKENTDRSRYSLWLLRVRLVRWLPGLRLDPRGDKMRMALMLMSMLMMIWGYHW